MYICAIFLFFSGLSGQSSYRAFKEKGEAYWASIDMHDPLERILELMEELRERAGSRDDDMLWAYNYVRELLEQPTIESASHIDWQWLQDAQEELLVLQQLEDESLIAQEGIVRATHSQTELITSIRNELGIDRGLAMLSYRGVGGFATSYYIALCRNPDLNTRLAALYHELTHVLYRDTFIRKQVAWGELSAEELLADPSLKDAVTLIDQYAYLGKKAFDHSTKLGRRLIPLFGEDFYKAPENQLKKGASMLHHAHEKRADLVELQKLFEHNYIDAILQEIEFYGFSQYQKKLGGNAEHPSDIERALYMAGFLAAHAIDVNSALRKREERGTCISSESTFSQELTKVWSPLSKGALDASNAYAHWRSKAPTKE